MQRHALDLQPVAPLLELRRPIPGAHGAEIRKKLPSRRTPFQDGLNVRAERRLKGLHERRTTSIFEAAGAVAGPPDGGLVCYVLPSFPKLGQAWATVALIVISTD